MAKDDEIVEIFVTDDEGRPEPDTKTFMIQRTPKTGAIKVLGSGQDKSKVPDRTIGISRSQFESVRGDEGIDIRDAVSILNEAEPAVSFSDSPTPDNAVFELRTQSLPVPDK